ncbi:hypothetical protein GALMADRAFT_46622, partial [Galerina marginata CBS 339.88]
QLNHSESPLATLVRRTSSRRARQTAATPSNPLPSPLLHSHFARDSFATASSSDGNSYWDDSSSSSRQEQEAYFDDGSSEYGRYYGDGDETSSVYSTGTTSRGPAVVISPAEDEGSVLRAGPGRAPVVKPVSANFSRPVRDNGHPGHAQGERPTATRAASPLSLYSTYSYYQYDSAVPSPTGSQHLAPPGPRSPLAVEEKTSTGPQTPQDYLQLGIQHHEANRLGESARCFERSANEGGGCGVGMLMYGLTLRHGWGCNKNEKVGFRWLMRAAESAVGDLEKVRTGGGQEDVGVVQTELVLAIYEVGQCFFHGWGVAKDQKMAVSYYAVAAQLGDGDAQADLAYCLANGKGCKKDKKAAANWYRAAVRQGQSDVGLAWIYKDKY